MAKNYFKINIPEVGEPIIEIKAIFSISEDNLHLFKEEYDKIIDKYRIKGI